MPTNQPDQVGTADTEGGISPYGILIVDDEAAILESLHLTLEFDYRVFTARSGAEGLEILDREDIALVITDQVMPHMTGVEFLEKVIERYPDTIRIMLTGYADMSSLIRAVNDGRIYRYIAKPWEPDDLRIDVKRALEHYDLSLRNRRLSEALQEMNDRLETENRSLRREVERRNSFEGIVGESSAMQRVFDLTHKVAGTEATVLITGETGTGKDLIARAIHHTGSRKENPFVAQNCGSLPDTLLESELFGHQRGAFTGAHIDKKGLFELADGGTVFLDEIGDTAPGMQVRLLRVLQDGEIRPLGSSQTRKVDVRVVAATNRDLREDVEAGRFREDLFYRLHVVEVALPALRERRDDISALAHYFLDRLNQRMSRSLEGFTRSAMDRLCSYDWPGNVRELENEMERIVVLAAGESLVSAEMLSERIHGRVALGVSAEAGELIVGHDLRLNPAVDAFKRRLIQEALRKTGTKTSAAERLGIPRQSLQKMMKRLQLTNGEGDG